LNEVGESVTKDRLAITKTSDKDDGNGNAKDMTTKARQGPSMPLSSITHEKEAHEDVVTTEISRETTNDNDRGVVPCKKGRRRKSKRRSSRDVSRSETQATTTGVAPEVNAVEDTPYDDDEDDDFM
jgi:hypothetical protein